MAARSQMLAERILEGEADHIGWIKEQWKCDRSTAFRYMNRARKMIAANTDLELETGRGLERLHICQQALMASKDYQGAARVQAEINKMLGLNKPDRVTFSGTVEGVQVYLPDNGRDSKGD